MSMEQGALPHLQACTIFLDKEQHLCIAPEADQSDPDLLLLTGRQRNW